jgi:hypothetical protein
LIFFSSFWIGFLVEVDFFWIEFLLDSSSSLGLVDASVTSSLELLVVAVDDVVEEDFEA